MYPSFTVSPILNEPASAVTMPGDHLEQRRLAGAVGADDADDAARRELEAEVLEQHVLAVGLRDTLGLDHHRARAAARAG